MPRVVERVHTRVIRETFLCSDLIDVFVSRPFTVAGTRASRSKSNKRSTSNKRNEKNQTSSKPNQKGRSKSKKGSKAAEKRKEYLERKELENEQLHAMGTPQLRGKKNKKKQPKKEREPIKSIPSFAVGNLSFGNPLRPG